LGLAPQVLAPPQVQVLGLASPPLASSSPPLLASPLLVISARSRAGAAVHSLPSLVRDLIFGIALAAFNQHRKKDAAKKSPASRGALV
jgi:hypothetical protein